MWVPCWGNAAQHVPSREPSAHNRRVYLMILVHRGICPSTSLHILAPNTRGACVPRAFHGTISPAAWSLPLQNGWQHTLLPFKSCHLQWNTVAAVASKSVHGNQSAGARCALESRFQTEGLFRFRVCLMHPVGSFMAFLCTDG